MINGKRRLFPLAATTAVGLFVVIIMGFLDTLTASTMGCGQQWPLCQGGIVPTHWTMHAVIEYSHRFVVLIVIGLLIVTSVLAWRKYHPWFEVKLFILLSVGAVLTEAGLGASSVLFATPPYMLAFHMGTSLVGFTSACLLSVVIRQIEQGPQKIHLRIMTPKKNRVWTRITIIEAFAAIYLGAYVTHSGHGGLFRGWPLPTEKMNEGLYLDIIHRGMAMLLFSSIIYLVYLGYNKRHERPDLYTGSLAAFTFTFLQILSGGAMIMTHASLPVFLTHISFSSMLFVSLSYLVLQSAREPSRKKVISDTHKPVFLYKKQSV